jgi:rsbT co-antagonist protein RsbR
MASHVTQAGDHRSPDLAATDQRALEDLWRVYGAQYDEISQEGMVALIDDPDFGPLIKSIPADEMERQNQRSKELLGRAMLHGEWTPYFADLKEQGSVYAKSGLSFVSWFRALSVLRPVIVRRLRAVYGGEPDRLFTVVDAMGKWFDSAMGIIGEAYLNAKQDTIVEQQDAIRELSTPVLTLMDGLLLLPVVGVIDSHRARQMTDQLLQAIHQQRAKVVVIDITGVAAVDSMVANHLLQAVEAAGLLGATAIVTGVSAEVAQTVVKIGVDLSRLRTVGDLQGGVVQAMRQVGIRLEAEPSSNGHSTTAAASR